MQPLLCPMTHYSIHQLKLLMEGEFGDNAWSNNCFRTIPTDPIKIAREIKTYTRKVVLEENDFKNMLGETKQNPDVIYFLEHDYDKVTSLLNKLSDEDNWDQNRKVFIADNNINKLCEFCILMLRDYYDYFIASGVSHAN